MDEFIWFTILAVAVGWSVLGVAGTGLVPERIRARVKRLENQLRKPYDRMKDGRPGS